MGESSKPTDPSADLLITVESAADLLLVTASGPASVTRTSELFKDICDIAVARGFNKILVDCAAVTGELSPRERHTLGKELADYQRSNLIALKIACLGREPVMNGVGVAIAQNRGLNIELFSDRQRALTWLHGPNSRPAPRRNTG
jgi:hypothetical protein